MKIVDKLLIVMLIALLLGVVGFAIRRSNQINQPKPVFVPKAKSERISEWLENGLHRVDYDGKVYLIYVSGGTGAAIIEHKAGAEK